MSDTATNNVINLDEYGSARRNSPQGASARALEDLRSLCCHRLSQNVRYMMTKSDDTLYGCAQMAESHMVRDMYIDAMGELNSISEDIASAFTERLTLQYRQGMPRLLRDRDTFDIYWETDPDENSQFNLSSMSEDLALAKMIAKTRKECARSLASLDKRIGLLISDPDLEMWQNPLSPESICEAFCATLTESVKQLNYGFEIRPVLLDMFNQYVLGNMDAVYRELNLLLIKIGVQPELPATGPESQPAAYSPLEDLSHPRNQHTGDSVPAPADYPLTNTQETDVPAPSAEEQTLDNPDPLQQQMDHHAVEESSDITLDVVTMLFDQLLEDKNMADSMRALISRLQFPLLKVATLDRSFFSSRTHPARQLINRISASAIGWNDDAGNDDPLYRKLESIVQTIIDDFDDDISLFSTLLDELNVFLDKREELIAQNTQRSIEAMESEEGLELASSTALKEIEPRIETQNGLGFINEFISTHWKNLLLSICAQEGKDSQEWQKALLTMDNLIWSVKPKDTAEDRQRLISMQTALLDNLREGMNRLSLPDATQDEFIAILVQTHTCTIIDSSLEQAISPEPLEISRDRTPRKTRASASPTPAQITDENINDTYLAQAKHIKPGTWIEILGSDGKITHAKLSWMSPITKTYLFTDRKGLNAGNYGVEELAHLLRCARARILKSAP